MNPDPLLHRLRDALSPSKAMHGRVRARVLQRTSPHPLLEAVKADLHPTADAKTRVWQRIANRTVASPAVTALEGARTLLSPAAFSPHPVFARGLAVRNTWNLRFLKWTAAVAVVALVVQGLPPLFLAPRTVALSRVTAIATSGEADVLQDNAWQTLSVNQETILRADAELRATDGDMTLILNDDGNVRLSKATAILRDDANRPTAAVHETTLELRGGRAWAQGFVPFHLHPIIIATQHASVRLHEGSVSVQAGENGTIVKVWDRRATITYHRASGEEQLILVAGEWAEITENNTPLVKDIRETDYTDPQVIENIKRDSVHRKDIAAAQRRRSIERAGILPTSPFYPVKRVAERVDVLMTFDQQAQLQRVLEHNATRLDEAAALIAGGNSGAAVPLQEEFRVTLIGVASQTGGNVLTQSIIRQEVDDSTAQLAASKPDDEAYALKVAVLETVAALPADVTSVKKEEVQAVLVGDKLDSLKQAVEAGNDTWYVVQKFEELQPQIDSLSQNSLPPELRKDVESSLQQLTASLEETAEDGAIAPSVAETIRENVTRYLPTKPPVVKHLSQAEIAEIIDDATTRILNLKQPKSRENQVTWELQQIEQKYPHDRGSLTRHLFQVLPADGSLRAPVRDAIQEIRTECSEGEC